MAHKISKLLSDVSVKIDARDARILLAHVIKKPIEFLIAHPEYTIGKLDNLKIKRLVKKRAQDIPLAYLTGHKEFFGFDFLVSKHTLVPRPETEVLVEAALKEIEKGIILIDIGTGTGCIPISILKSSSPWKNSESIFPILQSFAIDISKQALKIAQKNAAAHNVNITFLRGNLLEPVLKNSELLALSSKLIITANLPYLTQEQFDEETSIQHEPHSALVAEDNGLALYKKLLNQIQFLISHFQLHVSAFFEIDPSQAAQLSHYIQSQFPKVEIKTIKDGRENNRVLHATIDRSADS